MRISDLRGDPLQVGGKPDWWHKHGYNGQVAPDPDPGEFWVSSGEFTFSIRRLGDNSHIVEWRRRKEDVGGSDVFSDDELRALFGLSEESSEDADDVFTDFGAHVVVRKAQDSLRWREFVTFGGPATGECNDSGVSVYLTKEIRAGFERYIAARPVAVS